MSTAAPNDASQDIIYLAACAVNGAAPDADRVRGMDTALLYAVAERHMMECVTAIALERAGIKDKKFTQAKGKAIRKVASFELERARLFARFEEAGIWYMPLKGCVLKDVYPSVGMRQMSDNDILIDASRAEDARAIMTDLGFSLDSEGPVHDHYSKEPMYVFELHKKLFFKPAMPEITAYYEDFSGRLIKDDGNAFGYHFSDEDFYIYMIAHEYKHYSISGTGLRSLLDTYVFCKEKGGAMDWRYIGEEIGKMGLTVFEERNRNLATRLFGGGELTEQDRQMLEYVVSSGTYGTVTNRVKNTLDKQGPGFAGKVRYVLGRIFLPLDTVRTAYPLFIRWPILLPFLPIYRAFRGITRNRKSIRTELRTLSEYDSKGREHET